jgi:predicted dienelactone hydrolase
MRYFSLALFFGISMVSANAAQFSNVGFAEVQIASGSEPRLSAGIWYPTDSQPIQHPLGLFTQRVALDAPVAGRNLPLVVLSHGGGGSYQSHYDTGLALARAGFVAAAVSHAGDTYDDQSKVLELWRRPKQLRLLVSYMLQDWPDHDRLNANQIGAFGFSNGGFTVLVTAGGVPDPDKTGQYCQLHPSHDLCVALKSANVDPYHLGDNAPANAWVGDPRVRAVVIAAPAFAFAFTSAGLKNVHIPIQLWRAADDHHQPNPYYEEELRHNLPRLPQYHVVPGAGHYDFLPPCSVRMKAIAPAPVCEDTSGFDRARFHKEFNAQVVRFFRANLR